MKETTKEFGAWLLAAALTLAGMGAAMAEAVAKIGTAEYETLEAAFAEMKSGETVELLCDVDLKSEPWTPVALKGGFDGKGHSISNLVINLPEQNGVGFFSNQTDRKAVKNVEFVNVDVKGLCNVGAIFGRNCFGPIENVKVSGTIKVEAMGGDDYGYTRAGVICGGWSYAAYTNVCVDGGSKATSYVKGPKTGVDGRYVAGFVGHLDEDGYFANCTVKNLTVDGKYITAGFCGDGPGRVCTGCTVENVDLKASYSGALFSWLFVYGEEPALVENATIRNVTFADNFECGTVAEYTEDGGAGAIVKNVTIENVAPLKYNYQVYVTENGDNFHYANILAAVSDPDIDDLSVITVASDKIEVPAGYELYKKDDLWGVRELLPVVRVGDIEYSSIEVALANSSGDVEMALIGNATCGRITLSDADDPQIKSLTLDLNGFTLTDNGGDALLTKDRTITIRDSVGTGVFNHTGSDDCVWLQGTKGGVYLESGTFHLVDTYGLAYATSPATTDMLVITGGTYNLNPSNDNKGRNYVPDGYEAVNNGDGTWTVKEKAPPEVEVKDEVSKPEITPGVEIPEAKQEAVEQKAAAIKEEVKESLVDPAVADFTGTGVADAATETKKAGDEHQIIEVKPEVVAKLQEEAEKKEETKDAKNQITTSSKVESRVEIIFTALEVKIEIDEEKPEAEQIKATLNSVTYDVKPKVKTTVTTMAGGVEKQEVVETVIPNEVIAGNPITFRLAVNENFGAYVEVRHSDGQTNFEEHYLAAVTTDATTGKKYVQLSSDHFSEYTLTSTESEPVCRVGAKGYASLADAIANGGATAEIVLLENIELTEDVTLGYNQTIDPGEFAISGEGEVKADTDYEVRIVNGKRVVYAKPTEVTVTGEQKIAVCIEPSVLEQLGGTGVLGNVAENGFQVWQNYVMGVDGAIAGNKLVPICKPNAENPGAATVTVTTPIVFGAAPAKTGIAVTYQLLKSATPKSGFTMVGEAQSAPVFTVDTSAEGDATYWKIQAIFTPEAL